MRRSRELIGALAVSAALVLGGCAQGSVTVQSGSQSGETAAATPNLDVTRIETVLDATQSALTDADSSLDAEALGGRLSGPALQMRTDQYTIAKAKNQAVSALDLSADALTTTNSTQWPRAIFDITDSGSGGRPAVFVFTQDDARSDYKLENWTVLFGGTSLTTISPETGSPYLGPNATGYAATPAETIADYVDMLNAGDISNDQFAKDNVFAKSYVDDVQKVSDSIKDAGTIEVKASTGDFPVTGVVLQDGSALVAGAFTYTYTYARTVAGSSLKLGGDVQYLLDNSEVTGTVTISYLATVLVKIPAQGSDAKVEVVGADRSIESATRDDSKKPEGE